MAPRVGRLVVDGHDAAAGRDPVAQQPAHQLGAVHRGVRGERDGVGLPGPLGVVGLVRRLHRGDPLDRRGVAAGQPLALGQDLVEHLELAEPERRLHVGHAVRSSRARDRTRSRRRVALWRARSETSIACWRSWRRRAAATSASWTVIMPPSPVVMTLRGCSEKHASGPSEPIGRAAVRRADRAGRVLDERRAGGDRRARGMASMSAGSPSWCTGMIAFVRLGDRALRRRGVEVVGARVDVGEHRRGAALPHRVGGGDERQRRHDHLVAGADARDVERELQRGGAVASSRPPRRRRRARRRPPRTRARAGPARPSRRRSTSATASPSSPRKNGRAERDLHQDDLASVADRLGGGACLLGPPPLDQARQALLEVDLGLEAELARAPVACRRGGA